MSGYPELDDRARAWARGHTPGDPNPCTLGVLARTPEEHARLHEGFAALLMQLPPHVGVMLAHPMVKWYVMRALTQAFVLGVWVGELGLARIPPRDWTPPATPTPCPAGDE